MNKYQTLSDFVQRPFFKTSDAIKDDTYHKKYLEFSRTNKIRFVAMTVVEESYYFHFKVPSESQKDKGYEYDVVIRFFPDDPSLLTQPNLANYKIQFFSNSPSFIYHYAYVYKKHGYLIEDLFEKLDGDYEDKPPTKTNAKQVISYDKSIYFVTRYLNERKFRYLAKRGVILMKQVRNDKFFRNIADFQSIRFDQTLISEEKKLTKELEKSGSVSTKHRTFSSAKKSAGHSTLRDAATASITVVKKKTGGARVITKKKARTSTFRR